MKLLPYALGGLLFLVLVFALYVHSLPPTVSIERLEQTIQNIKVNSGDSGMTFEEAVQAEMMNQGAAQPDEEVVNLDGDSL